MVAAEALGDEVLGADVVASGSDVDQVVFAHDEGADRGVRIPMVAVAEKVAVVTGAPGGARGTSSDRHLSDPWFEVNHAGRIAELLDGGGSGVARSRGVGQACTDEPFTKRL